MRWRRRLRSRAEIGLDWWTAIAFMVGATLFALGSFPLYAQLVASSFVGTTFFVGSIFFTAAGLMQLVATVRGGVAVEPPGMRVAGRGPLFWAAAIQFVGTLLFNISTFEAMRDGLSVAQTNRLVWAPDMFGSVAFLLAGWFGWTAVCGTSWRIDRDDTDWWMAALNGVGAVVFMISGIASLTLPETGALLSLTLVNLGTFVGAVCFFAAAFLMLPEAD